MQSCDVYFYTLANNLGIDKVHEFLTRFGMGKNTGIDLDGEPSGLGAFPGMETCGPWPAVVAGRDRNNRNWSGLYPLLRHFQLAMVTATLANRGVRNQPRLVKAVRGQR